MKRPLSVLPIALLIVLSLVGCSAIPVPGAASPGPGAAAEPGSPDTSADTGADTEGSQGGAAVSDEDEAPLHTCTWEGDDGKREDVAIFGATDNGPFTRVQVVQLAPTETDLEHWDPGAVQRYLDGIKDIIVEEYGVDPSILTVDADGAMLRVTYECRDLDDLQSVRDYYHDDTVAAMFKTASGMPGVTTCDGKPVEKDDIGDFEADTETVRQWAEANWETGQAFLNGTLDEEASERYMDETHAIAELMGK